MDGTKRIAHEVWLDIELSTIPYIEDFEVAVPTSPSGVFE